MIYTYLCHANYRLSIYMKDMTETGLNYHKSIIKMIYIYPYNVNIDFFNVDGSAVKLFDVNVTINTFFYKNWW